MSKNHKKNNINNQQPQPQQVDQAKLEEFKVKYEIANQRLKKFQAEIANEFALSLVAVYRESFVEAILSKPAELIFVNSTQQDLDWAKEFVSKGEEAQPEVQKPVTQEDAPKQEQSKPRRKEELTGINKLIKG